MQVEEHARVEEPFELLARGGADLLDARPGAADQDRFLALAIDQDGAEESHQALGVGFLELVDDHRGGERQLVACLLQYLLADQLGHEEPLGLIGEVVLGVDRITFRQVRQQHRFQAIDALAGQRRDRDQVGKADLFLVLRQPRQQGRLVSNVNLVEYQDARHHGVANHIHQEAIAAAAGLAAIDDDGNDIGFTECVECGIDHPHVQAMQGLVDTRGIQEHDLATRILAHAGNAIAGGLGLVRDNRDLLPDQPVEQRGLARIGPADQRHKTGLHRVASLLPVSSS